MALKENDFVEINFTGKTKEGEVFDSNIKEDLKQINIERKAHGHQEVEAKPFKFVLGQDMFLKGVDNFLVGKPEPKKGEKKTFNLELKPENAFGKRSQELVRMMSLKTFREHGINPVQGALFNFDGRQGKVLTVSGGRVIVDFNNPLAGKPVEYKIEVLKKLEKNEEKVTALNEFFFRKEIPFQIKEKKVILNFENIEPQFKQIAKMFEDKYKKILGLDIEMKGVEEEKSKKKDKSDKKSQ